MWVSFAWVKHTSIRRRGKPVLSWYHNPTVHNHNVPSSFFHSFFVNSNSSCFMRPAPLYSWVSIQISICKYETDFLLQGVTLFTTKPNLLEVSRNLRARNHVSLSACLREFFSISLASDADTLKESITCCCFGSGFVNM